MPAGLDGNPDPIRTSARVLVVEEVAAEVSRRKRSGRPLLVAIDGIDGSGKSTFADELAAALREGGAAVVRSTIDSFHNPRSIRTKRGVDSPVGFYVDSHNLDAVRTQLLDPFVAGAGGHYVSAVFDAPSDSAVVVDPKQVRADDVLIFDGIFTQRPELADYWDLVVFLDGQERINLRRLQYVLNDLPTVPIDVVAHVLEWQRRVNRYAAGMQYYIDLVHPMARADIVVDNNDLASPAITKAATHG